MRADLSPTLVAARLAELRAAYVPMTAEEARRALASAPRSETLAQGAARRLAELRALMDLTAHLHGARRFDGRKSSAR